MIAQLAWKEYREHRSVLVAMTALAAVLLFSLAYFIDIHQRGTLTPDGLRVLFLAACVAASTYGLVSGAMMLAGEHEAPTQPFLDILSPMRTRVWGAKLLAGLVLTVVQSVLVAALLGYFAYAAGQSLLDVFWAPLVLLGAALEAFAWGLCLSAWCRNVLSAAGLAAVLLTFVWVATLVPGEGALAPAMLGLRLVGFAAIVWVSWSRYCRNDWGRAPAKTLAPAFASLVFSEGYPWLVLVGMTGFALLLGLGLLGQTDPEMASRFLVPGTAMSLTGVLFAALTTAGRRSKNAQLWPIRFWFSRLVVGLLTCGVVTLCFLPWTRLDQGLGLFLSGMEALAWGLLFGSWFRHPFPAFLAAAGVVGVAWLGTFGAAEFFERQPLRDILVLTILGTRAILAVAALVVPPVLLTIQSEREAADAASDLGDPALGRPPQLLPVFWLTWRQGQYLIPLLILAGILFGILSRLAGLWLWPVGTLALGIVCGVMVIAGEQMGGGSRFLGNLRVPPTWLWGWKTAAWFGCLAIACWVYWLCLVLGLDFSSGRGLLDQLEARMGGEAWPLRAWFQREQWSVVIPLAALWPVSGFAAGQFLCLVTRKPVVALVIAVLVTPFLLTAWWPSLVMGGMPWWEPFVPAAILAAGCRVLYWPWVSGELASGRGVLRAVGVGLLALAAIGGGLAYRVVQVPKVPDPIDLAAFERSMPTVEQNKAGLLIRSAVKELGEALELDRKEFPPPRPLPPGEAQAMVTAAKGVMELGLGLLRTGAALPIADPIPPNGVRLLVFASGMEWAAGPGVAPAAAGLGAAPPPSETGQEGASRTYQMPLGGIGSFLETGIRGGVLEGSSESSNGDAVILLLEAGVRLAQGGTAATLGLACLLPDRPVEVQVFIEPEPAFWSRELVLDDPLLEVSRTGWPADDVVLARRLNRLFAGGWYARLRVLPSLPLGVVDDPFTIQPYYHSYLWTNEVRQAFVLLGARAAQLQMAGQPAAALEHVDVALALARNLMNKASAIPFLVGRAGEGLTLDYLEGWVQRQCGNPALLKQALDLLNRHAQERPGPGDVVAAEYVLFRRLVENPAEFLRPPAATRMPENNPIKEGLFLLALEAPWEKERNLRLTNRYFTMAKDSLDRDSVSQGLDAILRDWRLNAILPAWMFRPDWRAADTIELDMTRLQLALSLYAREEGKPAAKLEDLVPRYLPQLPRDPFSESGRFRYRVSGGEMIRVLSPGPTGETEVRQVTIPAGTGVLWSPGPDRQDHGGQMNGRAFKQNQSAWYGQPMDYLFLVPAPR